MVNALKIDFTLDFSDIDCELKELDLENFVPIDEEGVEEYMKDFRQELIEKDRVKNVSEIQEVMSTENSPLILFYLEATGSTDLPVITIRMRKDKFDEDFEEVYKCVKKIR